MLTTGFAERVRSGEEVNGTFLKLSGLEPVDLLGVAGFDFGVVDMEHSQLDVAEASRILRHGQALGVPLVVRIPSADSGLTNRLLEAGASGVQLSSLRTSAAASALHAAMRYPPQGTRSVSTAQPAAGYGSLPLGEYLEASASRPPLVIGQIETAKTEDPLEAIFAHLDLVFIGTTDLSVDIGSPGDLEKPPVAERMKEVADTARRVGIPLGAFAASEHAAEALRDIGATYIVTGSDLQLLQQGLLGLGNSLKERRGVQR